jgi:hypothetical protein
LRWKGTIRIVRKGKSISFAGDGFDESSPAIGFAKSRTRDHHRPANSGLRYGACVDSSFGDLNNLPFEMISRWLAKCCIYLIIEFVPKQDYKYKPYSKRGKDIFTDYSESGFEAHLKGIFK